jgi:glutamate dehydrogenase/leucine dehydrogenase
MEIKFAVCGPEIGGAKSGINFDPADPRKDEVLIRWYKAVVPMLKAYYGTGGDLNVDEVKEVIPITEGYGLRHPQEGVLVGHYNPSPNEKDVKIYQLQEGVTLRVNDPAYSPAPEKHFLVADLITGWGVSEAVKRFYKIWGGDVRGRKAIIQGWGNVAAAAAWYLAQEGVKITGIIDRAGGLINPEGYSVEEVRTLFLDKKDNALTAPDMLSFEEANEKIWDTQADIFIPGAASRLVNEEQLERMKKAGVEVISCGANVPFRDKEIFFGPTGEYADRNFAVIPDFIANCGMARTFAYLMQSNIELSDKGIFQDVSATIEKALQDIHTNHTARTGIMEGGFRMVLDKLLQERA